MERAPHRDQCLHIVGRFHPRRKLAVDRCDLLFRFLDKQFQQFRVQVLGVCRDDWQRHDRGLAHRIGLGRRLQGSFRCGLELRTRNSHRRSNRFFDLFLLESLLDVAQYGQACLSIVQHVPGLAAAGFDRFHVVLDADNCVGQAIRFLIGELCRTAGFQSYGNQLADAIDHLHRARLAEHHQAGLDAPHQRRNVVQSLRRRTGRHALADRLLDARQVNNAFAHHGFGDLLIVSRFRSRQLLALLRR